MALRPRLRIIMSELLKKLNGPIAKELSKIVAEELAMIECPNHGGAFDCTPFCNLCEGNQEY
jgi:hypothetical protein